MRKILKHAPLIAVLTLTLMLTQISTVSSSSTNLEFAQSDRITYELKDVTSDMTYNNLTGKTDGFLNPMNMSKGDEMTFILGVVTSDTYIKAIEAYDPANNFSNTYLYESSDLFRSVFYTVPFPGTEWYETWFTYNLFYGMYYSHMHFVPWVLTTDWADHRDAWMDLLDWEKENGSFAGVADITGSAVGTTFTMTAIYNASKDTAMGTTGVFDSEIAYEIEVEYNESYGYVTNQEITLRDFWTEQEDSDYSSITMLWECKEVLGEDPPSQEYQENLVGDEGEEEFPWFYTSIGILVVVSLIGAILIHSKYNNEKKN